MYFRRPMFTPTRLNEIIGESNDCYKIRSRNGRSLEAPVKYASLSHCWGRSMPFKLINENLISCMQEIPLEKLSKVFKDAIGVASRCNISYIWIDSICKYYTFVWYTSGGNGYRYIQDSVSDWHSESSLMGSVYQHAYLNIPATGFENGLKGIFVERELELTF